MARWREMALCGRLIQLPFILSTRDDYGECRRMNIPLATSAPNLMCFLTMALLALCGCDESPKEVKAAQPPATTQGKSAPIKNAGALENRVEKLEGRVFVMEMRMKNLQYGPAEVSTEEVAYSTAKTPFGTFMVFCDGVIPYLDGFKVTLKIGNLTAADFMGAELELDWGLPLDTDAASAEGILKSQQHKVISVTDTFKAGKATPIEVILTPAKPAEIKTITVGIQLHQVSMMGPPGKGDSQPRRGK
jgi:hypothetical protein